MQKKLSINVSNVSKNFKLYYDKASTLKERLLFFSKRKKAENIEVLKNIDLKNSL